jgi:hypothetical protein
MEPMQEFDPVLYSREENEFLMTALDLPPVVAMRQVPPIVNPAAIKPILERVQELETLKTHEKQEWVGKQAIKDAIQTFFREDAKWDFEHRRRPASVPRYPSLYSWDAKGRGHLGGPGSDRGRIRTYFAADGSRKPFAVQLVPDYTPAWVAPQTERTGDPSLIDDAAMNRWECRVMVGNGPEARPCGHTESYKEGNRLSRNAARGRMSRHLRRATDNQEGHREVYTNEFGGSDAQR